MLDSKKISMDTEKISMDVKNISTANKTQTLDAETQTTEGEKIIYATERNKRLLIAKKNNLLNNKIFRTIKQNNYANMNK